MSEDLISRLIRDLRPVPRQTVVRRLAIGVCAGAAVSAVLIALTFGFRPDMVRAGGAMFWVKLAYGLGLGGLALWTCERLARPAGRSGRRARWLAAPVLALAGLAAWQLASAPAAMRTPMLMGHSALLCPWLILGFSMPPLAGLTWAARGLAPTRLRLTGAMIGLAAGGAGVVVYALHCDERAAPFLALWYTLGMLFSGLVGALTGPRLLRW